MQLPALLGLVGFSLVFVGLLVSTLGLLTVRTLDLAISIDNFPEYSDSYVCTTCPCENFTAALQGSVVSGRIQWSSDLEPATDYKVHLYLLMPDKTWWLRPSLAERDIPVAFDGTWEARVFSNCRDPMAIRFAAFLLPKVAKPDKRGGPYVCPCSAGSELFFDTGCLPPAPLGFPAAVIKRGMTDPFFQYAGHSFGKKICLTPCTPGNHEYTSNNVVVSDTGIELRITENNGVWQSAEIYTLKTLGYGTYLVQITGPFGWCDERA
jgi:hypothetical protein